MDVPKIEQRTFEQLQVVDVLAVGEVNVVPQERVQQRFHGMELVLCDIPQERSSERMGRQGEVINNLKPRPDVAAYSGAESR